MEHGAKMTQTTKPLATLPSTSLRDSDRFAAACRAACDEAGLAPAHWRLQRLAGLADAVLMRNDPTAHVDIADELLVYSPGDVTGADSRARSRRLARRLVAEGRRIITEWAERGELSR